MANLDTRQKRASSVNFWKPYVLDLPLPDGAIGQADRQQNVWDYSGILAIQTVSNVTQSMFKAMFRGMFKGMNG